MKRFPKLLAALLIIALFVGVCSTVSLAADLKEVRLTVDQLKVGYYNNTDLTGDIVLHCANSDVTKETKNLVDNKSYPYYWSKPYVFDDLKAFGGSKVPAILIDVANGGEGVNISGYEMFLREYLDCIPYSFEIQATTSANSNQWIKIFEDTDTAPDWNEDEYHCEFNEVTVYKVRILFYDIGEADVANDTADAYVPLPTNTTRLSLSEINLLTKREATTTPTQAPTQAPTEMATRPGIAIPTVAPTQAPTAAPTQVPTAAPTEAPTVAPTQAPTAASTEAPTAAPTQAPTEAPTAAPTQEATVAPTTPTTPTETTPVETTTPADATEPTVAPTEAPTEPAVITTVPATAPASAPSTNIGAGEEPDNTATIIIIVAIVAGAAIAGGSVFFILKKKRG